MRVVRKANPGVAYKARTLSRHREGQNAPLFPAGDFFPIQPLCPIFFSRAYTCALLISDTNGRFPRPHLAEDAISSAGTRVPISSTVRGLRWRAGLIYFFAPLPPSRRACCCTLLWRPYRALSRLNVNEIGLPNFAIVLSVKLPAVCLFLGRSRRRPLFFFPYSF